MATIRLSGGKLFCTTARAGRGLLLLPTVKEVGHMLRRLDKFAGVKALIIIPAWEGSVYWSLLRTGDRFIDKVLKHKI